MGRSGSSERARVRQWGAFAASLLTHALVYLALYRAAFAPPVLEFQLPSEVEFGLVDGDGEPAPAPAPPPPPPPRPQPKAAAAEPEPEVVASDSEGPLVDAGLPQPEADDAPLADAGVAGQDTQDALADAAVASGPDAGPFDEDAIADDVYGEGDTPGAHGDGFGVGAGGHGMGGFAPPGAAIGLHVDLERVRSSSLRLEERALLGIIPEWRKLLSGSGLDPLRPGMMQRVFVATPDLQRAHLVVAVRFGGKVSRVEKAVARLARGAHQPAAWTRDHGYRVAPWRNRGPTERVLALVADDQFTITRPVDLPRVLAVARGMARRQSREGMRERSGGNRALLDMYEDEAVALSIEDTRRFVVGSPKGIPESLRISVSSVDEFHARLVARGRYASPAEAGAAIDYLEGLRERLLDHPQVAFLGLTTAIEKAELDRQQHIAVLDMHLTLHQTRYLVEFVTQALRPRQRR